MKYRKSIESQDELNQWYNEKYKEMGGCWRTPEWGALKMCEQMGLPKIFDDTKYLLDIGSGSGDFTAVASQFVNAWGVDPSIEAIDFAIATHDPRYPRLYFWVDSLLKFSTRITNSFDYIASIGSMEHIPDLDEALEIVHKLLKPEGKWYFLVPNEKWIHEDQPNERTMPNVEWGELFLKHKLKVTQTFDWDDNTAFLGVRG